jgi:predicted nucleic acid-binding protein
VELLRTDVILLPEAPAVGVCRDPTDDSILACAAAGSVEYLVTGDADLLDVGRYQSVVIVNAREFLALLSSRGRAWATPAITARISALPNHGSR